MAHGSSSPTDWTVTDNPDHQRFEIDLGGALAIADYRLADGVITFTHTEVPPEHEGKGLGKALIRAGLAAARERGLKVAPTCPFFAAYIKRHAQEHDLLDTGWKHRLELN